MPNNNEFDAVLKDLVAAFEQIMPSAQVFVAQPSTQKKTENPKLPNNEAEYWKQKYMTVLDKYNTLLSGQAIRTRTHDTERSTITTLQRQVAQLTETVRKKNRELEAADKHDAEQRVAIANLQETLAELRERNAKIYDENKRLSNLVIQKDGRIKELLENLQRLANDDHPAQMTTPLGMLPINSQGMRRLADAYAQVANMYNRRSTDQSRMAEKNAALQKENDAYEALYRVLAETLREYDPKANA